MNTLILVAAALYGAAIGSFLNVCIFRFPRRCLTVWRPKGSFCPKCRRPIRWYENLPLISWLALLGRCRGCKSPISIRYFLVELATLLLFFHIAARRLAVMPDAHPQWGVAIVQAVVACGLIVCALVDLDFREIPDQVDVPLTILAPLAAALAPALLDSGEFRAPELAQSAATIGDLLESSLRWWGLGAGAASGAATPFRWVASLELWRWYPIVRAVFASLLGMGLGAGLIATIGWMGTRAFGREAMGFGDVKLMAMIGGFTGWQGILGTIAVASITGTIGGVAGKILSGRPTVTGREVDEASPLSYLALRAFGARASRDDAAVPLRPGGSLAARFATGDAYMPFGPFLALGALIVLLWPDYLYQAVLVWTAFVSEHATTISVAIMPPLLLLVIAMVVAGRRGGIDDDEEAAGAD